MAGALQLPIIDLSSPDRMSTSNSIRQACTEVGLFYLINHGVEEELRVRVFDESRKFFSLPLQLKLNLSRKEHRGYTPLYAEKLDPSSNSTGDSKESFYIGPLEDSTTQCKLNQWPSEELLPSWKPTMETYYRKVLSAGKRLISLIALALNLDEDFFEKVGALTVPSAFLRLLHYPVWNSGELESSNEEIYGASAHSDYGMITLLATDGVRGLQVCREKQNQPRIWEDVQNIDGAFIVNIGDMMERWTNCLFRSTLHRVMPAGQERYSVAFFLDPSPDCLVECLRSCCSESCPGRFPPIRSKDYLEERFSLTYA
ncbi:2OG-FeII_Oxy domain-containing protein/DIOX_N domain-containing protein [Cephalotus follicularis]|uniref:2OG-FeII_Oxy domain-containing protein/DIOX_N domain-containing protein n=1 Tax=Cephalotus follicularis TaxID=3775 RepID=A0A1Q3CD00_CEPFO|nr:2OG-FeII_Oxy domain-containing protein/DIOX_N domain-containing protein [Cephalotus follicularis]